MWLVSARWMRLGIIAIVSLPASLSWANALQYQNAILKRNAIVFVADGLRHGSVNMTDTPMLYELKTQGVDFSNSHSLFPTFTTANASAIATGHYLGDTGDFGNSIFVGYPIFSTGSFGQKPGSVTPYIENDLVLGDLDEHYGGNYLDEETFLAAARSQGYLTAAIGKVGPAAIQDIEQLSSRQGRFDIPATIILDDATGTPNGIPLSTEISAALSEAGLPTVTPPRKQPSGNNVTPGTTQTNEQQQSYFADATTKVILPILKKSARPFVVVYWSRDPDGTQHNQGDSLNTLVPGINGPTSRKGLRDADNNLSQILKFIREDPQLTSNTDIFVTADHGFATVSRHEISGHDLTKSYSAQFIYRDNSGREEVNHGFLPPGFLAIDLAHYLQLPLFDPDSQIDVGGTRFYEAVDPTVQLQKPRTEQHPASGAGLIGSGNGLIGGSGRVLEKTDAQLIIAGNGGCDLIYVPSGDPKLVNKIVGFLAAEDYVGGLFVNDRFGNVPGALPLSSIRLLGLAKIPAPTIVVALKTFELDPGDPITAVQVADTSLQEGQGMHGGFGRGSTFNFMAAIGPDFKTRFVDKYPVSNADIAPTLAYILKLNVTRRGKLVGRVLGESLEGGPTSMPSSHRAAVSAKTANGKRTVLMYQQAGQQLYFDEACFVTRPRATCR